VADQTNVASVLAEAMNGEESLEAMLREHRNIGLQHWKGEWSEYTELQRFANGEQWKEADKRRMDGSGGPSSDNQAAPRAPRLSVNEIGPVLQTFSGREMMQRFERGYVPRNPAAAREAEVMTAVDRAFMHAADAEQVISAAFKDGPGIQGVSCVRWELDDLNERGGGILLTDLPMWQVMADPEARAVNLSDRAWHRYGKWWPQKEVKDRWPEKWNDVVNSVGGGRPWNPNEATDSSRIPWAGMAGNKPMEVYYPRGKMLWVEYEEWKEIRAYWEVGRPADPTMSYADAMASALNPPEDVSPTPDPFTSERVDTAAKLGDLKKLHRAAFSEDIPRELISRKREVAYKYAYACGDTVLETGDVPIGYWTIQFLTGFRFPQPKKTKFTSLVSRLQDPQKWVNVMLSALIRNLQISPKGLLFVEDGFFKNRNEAMSAWASPGGLIQVARGKLTGGAPGYKWESGGTAPYQGMVESMMSFYREAIPRLAGFNPGALGQLGGDLRRISGQVVRQVQDAAMVANAEPYDALRHFRREGGRIFLAFMRTFFEVEDLIRVVGEDVAYENVINPTTGEPVPEQQPEIDPATGQPAVDAQGQPKMQLVYDDNGVQKFQKRLAIPAKDEWKPDYWKEIAVEDVAPVGDQLQALWDALQTSIQQLLEPRPDTGEPLLSSKDLVKLIPGIPSQIRQEMLQRVQAALTRQQQQKDQKEPAKPPSMSISLKDLPPDGQAQMAKLAGIEISPPQPPPDQNGSAPPQASA
jgi:hypothetical protein